MSREKAHADGWLSLEPKSLAEHLSEIDTSGDEPKTTLGWQKHLWEEGEG